VAKPVRPVLRVIPDARDERSAACSDQWGLDAAGAGAAYRVAELAGEFGVLAEQTGNGDLAGQLDRIDRPSARRDESMQHSAGATRIDGCWCSEDARRKPMTQPPYYHPYYYVAPPAPQNGLGTAGFVLGLVGLVFSPIPIIGVIAWPLAIIGLVLSFVGVHKADKGQATNGGLAIAGSILSALALMVCILWVVAFGEAVSNS
jgi:hypothetical protein